METILIVFHLMLSVGLIGLILIQHGKGADMGAAFGSGASATVFGARGSASFLSRTTAVLATLFFVTSMVLAYFATQATDRPGLMDIESVEPATAPQPVAEVPVVPGETAVPVTTVESSVPTTAAEAPAAAETAVPVPAPEAPAAAEAVAPGEQPAQPAAGEGETPSGQQQ